MVIAFARSIHKFQGLSAGPTSPGQIPNIFPLIICHPGTRKFEGNAPGTLYVAVSRATTLGDEHGLNSALYFQPRSIPKERIKDIKYKTNKSELYERVKWREQWVQRIKNNTKSGTLTEFEQQALIDWSTTTRITKQRLGEQIQSYTDNNNSTYT